MNVKIAMLDPKAILPEYATEGAACFDLHALAEVDQPGCDCGLPVEFFGAVTFRTGLAFEISAGYVLKVYSRSGHGFKHDVCLANSVGVIDSDYRGEVLVRLTNHGDQPFTVNRGDRIAQAMLIAVPRVEFQIVDTLSDTARGAGGFGSTGR